MRNRSWWYRSLYWRIGATFVLFVMVVIIVQSVIFTVTFEKRNLQDTARSPNNVATKIAADLGALLARGPEAVRLSVIDSGADIAPEHVPHVFDRFYKVDVSCATRSEGSGLGLSIAKAIVERHGGSMEVTSVPGRTEFTVVLPRHATEAT